ncbi:AAA family ATPase [Bacteroidota bacterium]
MSHFLPYREIPVFEYSNSKGILQASLKPYYNLEKFGIGIKEIKNEVDMLAGIDKVSDEEKQLFSGTELLNRNTDSLPCLCDPFLQKIGVVALAGGSDAGKSCLLRQLAISVVTNQKTFLGFILNAIHNRAIYVSTEDDELAISFLLNKANNGLELPPEAYKGLTYIFDTSNLIERLEGLLSKEKVDLIVIDAFSDLYGKSINETNQVRTFLNQYSQLAQRYKCLIIFLHHTGKRTEDLIPSKNNLLGSQGFEAKMRAVFELRLDPVEANKRHFCIVKGNYLPREFKTESYVLTLDENLLFDMTDERRPFEELKASDKSELKEKVRALHDEGKTQKEISVTTGLSQPTVSRYLNE